MSVTGRGKGLLGGLTPKLFADCFPRDHSNCGIDKKIPKDSTELGQSQPLAGEVKGRGAWVGMGMRCHPCSLGARTISGPNNLCSELRATIHVKRKRKQQQYEETRHLFLAHLLLMEITIPHSLTAKQGDLMHGSLPSKLRSLYKRHFRHAQLLAY